MHFPSENENKRAALNVCSALMVLRMRLDEMKTLNHLFVMTCCLQVIICSSCAFVGGYEKRASQQKSMSTLTGALDKNQIIRIRFEAANGEIIERAGFLKSTPSAGVFLLMPEVQPSHKNYFHPLQISYEKIKDIKQIHTAHKPTTAQVIIPLAIIIVAVFFAIKIIIGGPYSIENSR